MLPELSHVNPDNRVLLILAWAFNIYPCWSCFKVHHNVFTLPKTGTESDGLTEPERFAANLLSTRSPSEIFAIFIKALSYRCGPFDLWRSAIPHTLTLETWEVCFHLERIMLFDNIVILFAISVERKHASVTFEDNEFQLVFFFRYGEFLTWCVKEFWWKEWGIYWCERFILFSLIKIFIHDNMPKIMLQGAV